MFISFFNYLARHLSIKFTRYKQKVEYKHRQNINKLTINKGVLFEEILFSFFSFTPQMI